MTLNRWSKCFQIGLSSVELVIFGMFKDELLIVGARTKVNNRIGVNVWQFWKNRLCLKAVKHGSKSNSLFANKPKTFQAMRIPSKSDCVESSKQPKRNSRREQPKKNSWTFPTAADTFIWKGRKAATKFVHPCFPGCVPFSLAFFYDFLWVLIGILSEIAWMNLNCGQFKWTFWLIIFEHFPHNWKIFSQ
jgi:hypothetical protein